MIENSRAGPRFPDIQPSRFAKTPEFLRRHNREVNKLNREVARSINRVLPSAVSIRTLAPAIDLETGTVAEQIGIGAGFVIASDAKTAVIATNAHVAKASQNGVLFVETSGAELSETPGQKRLIQIDPESIYISENHDIAFIPLDLSQNSNFWLQAVTLGESSKLTFGQAVLSVGAPHALTETFDLNHIAHNSYLDIPINNETDKYIQLGGSVRPGNSGGMVVNHAYKRPEVVGMVSIGISNDPTTGFMLPAETIKAEYMKYQASQNSLQPSSFAA